MRIYTVDPETPASLFLENAAEIIQHDGLVVYPTETVYGIGANALSDTAVQKVIAAKERDDKPISIACHSVEQAKHYGHFNALACHLAAQLLPGPLTLLVPPLTDMPAALYQGQETIGLRVPDHPLVRQLIATVDRPITATSANLSGELPAHTAEEARQQLGDTIDLYLDAGSCNLTIPSTVAEVHDTNITIHREGAISRDALRECLQTYKS